MAKNRIGILRLLPGQGEILCPRKGAPLGNVISEGQCLLMHEDSPEACAEYECQAYTRAQASARERAARAATTLLSEARAAARADARALGAREDDEAGSDAPEERGDED